jgi:hypothetical protein
MGSAIPKIPLGKGKGLLAVMDADDAQLMQFLGWFDGAGNKPEKWAKVADAARAELSARAGAPADKAKPAPAQKREQRREPPPKQQQTALVKAPPPAALSLAHDANAINARFAELRQHYHLVSPATHVDMLPDGFGVSIAFVQVDTNTEKDGPGDVYTVGKKVGLSGHVIQQIGAASAVDWDSRLSGRLDDRSDPHYVYYRAVGWAKNYDGTPRQIMGEVEIDARDGGPLVEEIIEKAARRKQRYPDDGFHDGGASQILELRKFILRHAETKAQNRAICKGLGVKRAYTKAELKKPFAIARLSFTGYSEDPELRRKFAEMGAAAALGGSRALYGGEPTMPALPAAAGIAPPPLDTTGAPLDAEDMAELAGEDDGEVQDAEFEPDPDPGNEAGEDTAPMRQPGED